MSFKPARVQFNGGELSPWLEGRTDIAKYDKTAKLCRNFIPLAEGSLKRRGGTHFVAETADDTDVRLTISAVPAEAEIFINGKQMSTIVVARGDQVTYSVRATGYFPKSGTVVVNDNMTLNVYLLSQTETYTLRITTTPTDAVVKIAGYERKIYAAQKNELVEYSAKRTGYEYLSGSVLMTSDKTLSLTLKKEEETVSNYGDWGNPVAFISCTVAGYCGDFYKCFLILFENGYLPVKFSPNSTAPSSIDEKLFVYTTKRGYNTYSYSTSGETLAVGSYDGVAMYYKDLEGTIVCVYITYELEYWGWPKDSNGKYFCVYNDYDGNVVGSSIKVYYKGNLVWTLNGRK